MRVLKTEDCLDVGGGLNGFSFGAAQPVAGTGKNILVGFFTNWLYDRAKDIYTNSYLCPGSSCVNPNSSSSSNSNSGYGSVSGGSGVPGFTGNNPSSYTSGTDSGGSN